ncbi:MAG: hypothetical protein WC683_01050 [bacterium]
MINSEAVINVAECGTLMCLEDLPAPQEPYRWTQEEFKSMVGRDPLGDDLERLNCPDAGLRGHLQCGYCPIHQKPRWTCGCIAPLGMNTAEIPAVVVVSDPETDPYRLAVDMERIAGWPGLAAFKPISDEAQRCIGLPMTSDVVERMRRAVQHLLLGLVQLGALRRGFEDRSWEYREDPNE